MRYEILGPLRVVDENGSSFISARKIEILLAVLLIRADRVVTTDQLIAEIWGEEVPRRATACLHVYISQLRKFLYRPGRQGSPIVTRLPGYLLRMGSDEFDLRSFQQLVSTGRTLFRQGRHAEASERFERALGLWRGPAFNDLGVGPTVAGCATWLAESRVECIEMLTDAQLELGLHRELVGRLYSLTAEYPLREAFYRQLMLALYRSERQADALGVYQLARKTLNDELGLEPCLALKDLQRAILTADARLDLPPKMPMIYARTMASNHEATFLRYRKITADARELDADPRDLYDMLELDKRTDRILPNGWCLLPPRQLCGTGNTCLTCDKFTTDATFLPDLTAQLTRTEQLIAQRREVFRARTGQELSQDNIWLAGRIQEQDALGRIIDKLKHARLANGTMQALGGPGAFARTDVIAGRR